MDTREHTRALLEHLRAHPRLSGIVFDGVIDGDAPTRYVLVFAHTPERVQDRFAGRQRPEFIRHTIHSVGAVPAEAQNVADWVQETLQPDEQPSVRLDVSGRTSGFLEHDDGGPMRIDTSRGAAVYYLADEYVWRSTPARRESTDG